MGDLVAQLRAESWTWYSIGIFVVICRYISRYMTVRSLKQFQPEDYLMGLVVVFYTIVIVSVNIISHTSSNLLKPGEYENLSPDDIKTRVYGSKVVLVVEQCQLATIWGCKACLLLIYSKMTLNLKQHTAVKIIAAYVGINFIILEGLYFGYWCRPFYEYWQVPSDNVQCTTATNHLILTMVFNISSDILMMCIPLPLLAKAQLPLKTKLMLCGIFSMGLFIILCATLSKVYSFHNPFGSAWLFWYTRECSTAFLVANLPNCWVLIRHVFNLTSLNGSYKNATYSQNQRRTQMYGTGTRMTSKSKSGVDTKQSMIASKLRSSSKRGLTRSDSIDELPLEIWQQVNVEVKTTDDHDQHNSNAFDFDIEQDAGLKHGIQTRVVAVNGNASTTTASSSRASDDRRSSESIRGKEDRATTPRSSV